MSADLPFTVVAPTTAPVPLLVSIPHTGTEVPDAIAARMTDAGRLLADTDWHLHRLYGELVPALGARLLFARYSRYVVDLNRPASGEPLYPGQSETRLVPVSTFAEERIYRDGQEPDAAEVAERVARFWQPYHQRLRAELDDLRQRFGYALLFDAHSIRSLVPRFWPDPLPDLMLGDADGTSTDPTLAAAVRHALAAAAGGARVEYNFRFKGGYITRAHGRPKERVHALQLEMCQHLYMDEAPPFGFDEVGAARLRPALAGGLSAMVDAAHEVLG